MQKSGPDCSAPLLHFTQGYAPSGAARPDQNSSVAVSQNERGWIGTM